MALPRAQRLKTIDNKAVDSVRLKPLEVRLVNKLENKACMVIPKRYISKATDRNSVRRSCLELVRKTFKNRQIGAIMIRVYTIPDDLEAIPQVLSQCINKLRC